MKSLLLAILISIALLSCKKDETPVITGNAELVGTWVNPQYSDTLVIYSRVDNLIENEPGYSFKPGNTLICRQNSGWCGTPPITTADYGGTWSWSDSVVDIKTAYWGGKSEFQWKIISLTDKELVITVLKAD